MMYVSVSREWFSRVRAAADIDAITASHGNLKA